MSTASPIIVAAAEGRARVVEECLRTVLPSCTPVIVETSALVRRELPDAACAVVVAGFGGWPALEGARALRASGFEQAMVAVVESPLSPDERRSFDAIGALPVVEEDGLASALSEALASAMSLDEDSPLVRDLRRTQRLIASGEIARKVQHGINNPLTALLAEAQLLEMEPMTEEQREAVRRMIELCRRVAAVVRQLDVVAPVGPVAQAPAPPTTGGKGNGGRHPA